MAKTSFIVQFVRAFMEAGSEFSRTISAIPYKGFRMVDRQSSHIYRQGVRNLAYRGIIKYKNRGYCFTPSGKKWLNGQLLKYYRYAGIKWDGKWRIVIFDIPGCMNRQRHAFRSKIKALGFHMIQRSVFAIPYPCEQEISDICRKLKLTSYVDIILAESILSHEEDLRKAFGL